MEGCRKVNMGPPGHRARPTLTSSAHEEVGFGYLPGHTDGDHVSPAFAAARCGSANRTCQQKRNDTCSFQEDSTPSSSWSRRDGDEQSGTGTTGSPCTARTGHTWQDPGTSERAASTWLLSGTETRSCLVSAPHLGLCHNSQTCMQPALLRAEARG